MELKALCVCEALPHPHPVPCAVAAMPAGHRHWPKPLSPRRGGSLLVSPALAQNCALGVRSFSVSRITLAPELLPCLCGPISSLWYWKLSMFSHRNEQQNLQRNIFFRILIYCLSPSLNLYLSLYVRRRKQQDLLRWCLCRSEYSDGVLDCRTWNVKGQAGRADMALPVTLTGDHWNHRITQSPSIQSSDLTDLRAAPPPRIPVQTPLPTQIHRSAPTGSEPGSLPSTASKHLIFQSTFVLHRG